MEELLDRSQINKVYIYIRNGVYLEILTFGGMLRCFEDVGPGKKLNPACLILLKTNQIDVLLVELYPKLPSRVYKEACTHSADLKVLAYLVL